MWELIEIVGMMLLTTFADKTYMDFADNICSCLKAKRICKHDFVRTHHA